MSEETRSPSSPDDIEVTTDEPVDPKAARRARRAKAKLALRIPDDEVMRPQAKSNGDADSTSELPAHKADHEPGNEPPVIEAEAIKPSRIISVGPPPPDPNDAEVEEGVPESAPEEIKTVRRFPSTPPTTKLEGDPDDALTPAMPPVNAPMLPAMTAQKTVVDVTEGADDDDIDVPVDEEEPIYRAKMPTIPSNPPPPPGQNAISARATSQPPEPLKAKGPPSEDALEIDDVEAAAVLSSRPPPRPMTLPIAPIPPAPRVPAISSKPPGPPPSTSTPPSAPLAPPPVPPAPSALAAPIAPIAPITPPIPVDAMSSTPHLGDEPSRPRAIATALVDDEEARGIEEIEPDRASAPPSIDSGDEIETAQLVSVAPKTTEAARVSTPPKAPAAKPPLPFRETLKDGAGFAPKEPAKDVAKEGAQAKLGPMPALSQATPAAGTQSPLAPPALHEGLVPRRRARPWWEDLFNDDFIRTMPKFTDAQIADEVDFIEDSLGVARGGTMLDLGCGTGRHAIELVKRGYSVVGFDLSLAMLARAGEEAQERNQKINFVQGDMREMTFDEAFDGIFCWGSTFGYFEEEKNIHVLNRVHKALRHGGQFLLDVVSRDFIARQSPSLAWFEGEGCVCMDEMNVDWITSRMRVKRTMMLDDGRSKEIEYSIRTYALHELGKLLHDNGFRVAEVSGRIQTPGVFFGPESPRTLILAEKR